ncbi:BON domain-containing protein [Cupriavidus pauculus]|uniref:Transporter n=1 Tax=Cupriavidus pauculus TaxID=82633 RepID=A0A2N5C348_9BURK|nr:BON domain-containing protein [Cupriavidus pauculus]PLP96610.1 transporter [Cupriavidus pauculus]
MKTVHKLRIAMMVTALAAAGGAHALDNGGFMKVADTSTTSGSAMHPAPANNASGMSSRTEGDRTNGATTDSRTDASADNAKQAVTDSALTTKIKTKLLTAKDLKSTGIHVKTKDRVVNLTGSVPSSEQKQLAVDTVKSVEGVDSVSDNLKVSSR